MSNIKGKLIVKNDAQTYGSNGFRKRDFVIETEDEQYPQKIQFELVQDKCELLDKYNIGDVLDVHYNLRGREWTNPQGEVKYFNSLQAWRIEGEPIPANQVPQGNPQDAFEPADDVQQEEDDNDLPF